MCVVFLPWPRYEGSAMTIRHPFSCSCCWISSGEENYYENYDANYDENYDEKYDENCDENYDENYDKN